MPPSVATTHWQDSIMLNFWTSPVTASTITMSAHTQCSTRRAAEKRLTRASPSGPLPGVL
jgi:hypothetical protein